MDQIKVQIVELQFVERPFERLFCPVISSVRDPQFRRDEDLFPWHATSFYRSPDGFFVLVNGGRVDRTVADLERVDDASFTFFGVRDLVYAKTQNGHFYTVVQSNVSHISSLE